MIWLVVISIVGISLIAVIWSIRYAAYQRDEKTGILKEALAREQDIKETLDEVEKDIRTSGNSELANSVRDKLIRRREQRLSSNGN